MGDSVTPEVEVLSNMIRQYFSQERSEEETIRALNHLRRVLHEVSPFAQEPVDQLLGRKADTRKRLKGWLPVACINPERKG